MAIRDETLDLLFNASNLPVTTGAELATVASDVASNDLDTTDAILNAAVVADAEIYAFFPANFQTNVPFFAKDARRDVLFPHHRVVVDHYHFP